MITEDTSDVEPGIRPENVAVVSVVCCVNTKSSAASTSSPDVAGREDTAMRPSAFPVLKKNDWACPPHAATNNAADKTDLPLAGDTGRQSSSARGLYASVSCFCTCGGTGS